MFLLRGSDLQGRGGGEGEGEGGREDGDGGRRASSLVSGSCVQKEKTSLLIAICSAYC